MKYYHLFLIGFTISCGTATQNKKSELVPNDTISTGTGLQYYYITKGEGRKIEEGAKVSAYNRLYLNDVDTVFWSTDTSEDSVFSFIQGKTSLIKGALELYPLLREGDEVVAIMPDSIAYGKEDNNGLPGGSTLIFNPIVIKFVSEPKAALSDTLIAVMQTGSVEDMMEVYYNIANSDLQNNYHMDLDLTSDLFRSLMEQKRFAEVENAAALFEAMAQEIDDLQGFWYYRILAVAQQDTARAITLLNETIAKDPDEVYWKNMLKSMTKNDD